MKNTYVNCKDWSWEDKLLYMKACIGDNLPHSKICGYVSNSKSELLSMYQGAHYIYCCDSGMIVFDRETKTPAIYDRTEVKLSGLKPQTKEVEWANGDACRYANDIQHEYTYIGEHPHGDGHYVFSEEKGITYIANGYLLEPETEAERKERERLEAVEEMFTYWSDDKGDFVAGDDDDRWVKELLFSLHDAGYKKVSL